MTNDKELGSRGKTVPRLSLSPAVRRLLGRSWFWGAGVVLLLVASVLVALPYAVAYGFQRWALAHGAEVAGIRDVDLNPFTGRLVVHGLHVRAAGRSSLQVRYAQVQIAPLVLLHGEVWVASFSLEGGDLSVERAADGSLRVGGLNVAGGGGGGAAWGVGIRSLSVSDTRVHYLGAGLDTTLDLRDLALTRIRSWRGEAPGKITLAARLDGTPLHLAGTLTPFADSPGLDAQVTLNGLDLARFASLLPARLGATRGTLVLDTQVRATFAPDGSLSVAQNGLVRLNGIEAHGGTVDLSADDLEWNGRLAATTHGSAGGMTGRAEGALEGGRTRVALPAEGLEVRHAGLSWRGVASVALGAPAGRVEVSGQVAAKALLLVPGAGSTDRYAVGGLDLRDLHLAVAMPPGDPVELTQTGRLSLRQVEAQTGVGHVSDSAITWVGKVDVALPPDAGPHVQVDGRIEDRAFDMSLPAQGLHVVHGGAQWQGRLAYGGAEAGGGLAGEGRFSLARLKVDAPDQQLDVLSLGSADLNGIGVKGVGDLTVSGVVLTKLHVARELGGGAAGAAEAPLLEVARAAVEGLRLKDGRDLSIQSLALDQTDSLIRREKDGRWRAVSGLLATLAQIAGEKAEPTRDTAAAAGAEAPPEAAERPRPVVRVAKAVIQGDSGVRFEDLNVSPPFRARFTLKQAELSDLDSSRPDKPSMVTLVAGIGDYSKVHLNGVIQPFAKRLTLDLNGKLSDFDLPPLSSYTARTLGYTLESGHLDADLHLRVKQGVLAGESSLLINNLAVAPQDPEKMGKMTSQLSVPLEAGLAMLQDADNNIHLKLPVEGDINSPKFDLSDAINQAIGKAMRTAAMGFLKYALQPFGALITIAQLAGEAASAVRLEPVKFAPGEATLDPAAGTYLTKVAGVLAQRPALRLKLCGAAVAGDRETLASRAAAAAAKAAASKDKSGETDTATDARPQPPAIPDARLEALARERAAAVKALLVREHGIKPDRLFICQPAIDKAAAGLPRVDLLI